MSARDERAPGGPATYLTAERRAVEIEALADGVEVDLLVIGGGVTGAGVALDAVTRGLSVAVVEQRDLANGTSRFSSKLAHGGLRYLAKLQFGIAWESARERAILADVTAPHLIRALPQLTPVWGRFPPPSSAVVELGYRIGDGMRALSGTSHKRLPRMRRVGAAEARLWAPAVRTEQLRGAILAWDGQLEDDARLVVALARTAAAHGARVCTYCEVEQLTEGGAHVRDTLAGESFELRARHVINATGVWADRLVSGLTLRPSKGAHLLVRSELLGSPRAAVNVGVPGHFGRVVFAIPRDDGLVMIGLTDDAFEGAIPDEPPVTAEDERFLLDTVSLALQTELTSGDVVGSFAGLRPLLDAGDGSTADVSRRHAVIEDAGTGAVTVVGGKLTTYRQMAQDAVDVIAARPGVQAGPCRTTRTRLVGAPLRGTGISDGVPGRLWRRFGTEASEIMALAHDRPELLGPLAPGLPVLGVELVAAIEREGAITIDDMLDRRTRLGLVPAWREQALPAARETFERLARIPA
jgi:glycerol-3-phosphate dehydrogenase